MIRDGKVPGLTWALGRYVQAKLRSAFRGVWARGELPAGDEPLLVYANHSSWWDGFTAHALAAHARRDGYAVMEEQHLARYRFLRRLGAFSLRRGDAASAMETFRHARQVLRRPGATVFLFPQGEQLPFGQALEFERGVEVLARLAKVRCVPVALRFTVFEHERPDALVQVGTPHAAEPLAAMTGRLSALVESLARATSPEGFAPLLAGRRGVAERWDAVRGLAPATAGPAGALAEVTPARPSSDQ